MCNRCPESPTIGISKCRRFCSCPLHLSSTKFDQRKIKQPNRSLPILCDLLNSIESNKDRNLVRDQGVGGSNPLSPTIFSKHLNRASGFPSTSDGVEILDGACFADLQSNFQREIQMGFSRQNLACFSRVVRGISCRNSKCGQHRLAELHVKWSG
jgi:hypothetical protein